MATIAAAANSGIRQTAAVEIRAAAIYLPNNEPKRPRRRKPSRLAGVYEAKSESSLTLVYNATRTDVQSQTVGGIADLVEQTQSKSTGISVLRGWLVRPVKVKNPIVAFVCCLALLAFAPIPDGGKPLVFLVAIGLGIGTVSAMVFSPDLGRAGSNMASFFLAYLMHGLIALAAVRGGYYPRVLAGNSFGQAINHSALFVLVEWGAIMLLGRAFAASRRPTLPRWVMASAALALAAVLILPWMQGLGNLVPWIQSLGNLVVDGAPPLRHWRFFEPRGSGELPTALLDDVFIRLWWDRRGKATLKGWDIKNGQKWTMDVKPSMYMLPRPSWR